MKTYQIKDIAGKEIRLRLDAEKLSAVDADQVGFTHYAEITKSQTKKMESLRVGGIGFTFQAIKIDQFTGETLKSSLYFNA